MSWLLTRTLRLRLNTALRVAVPWTQVHGYLVQRYLIWGALQLADTPTTLKGGGWTIFCPSQLVRGGFVLNI